MSLLFCPSSVPPLSLLCPSCFRSSPAPLYPLDRFFRVDFFGKEKEERSFEEQSSVLFQELPTTYTRSLSPLPLFFGGFLKRKEERGEMKEERGKKKEERSFTSRNLQKAQLLSCRRTYTSSSIRTSTFSPTLRVEEAPLSFRLLLSTSSDPSVEAIVQMAVSGSNT